ncbi:MAG: class I SAM-dependent methyltransferase [Candidatus Latescibacteria bacterium]|nr:class I SAM-dependent methyltransferase [Candidatus Latescibacterota bacterium]
MVKKSLDEVLDIVDSIPEKMCGRPQPLFLYNLSKKTKGTGEIVEIGTCAGHSAIAMSYAQIEKKGRKINTIDIAEHPELENNLKRAGVSEYVKRIVRRSSVVAATWDKPIELLFIDGDHRYNAIVVDIECWSKFVVEGGIMAFHDYPGYNGLNEAWKAVYDKVMSKPEEWRLISDREAGSIIVFEKIRQEDRVNSHWYNPYVPGTMKLGMFGMKVKYIVRNLLWSFEEFREKRKHR